MSDWMHLLMALSGTRYTQPADERFEENGAIYCWKWVAKSEQELWQDFLMSGTFAPLGFATPVQLWKRVKVLVGPSQVSA